ncbi:HDOD domain-containing protein [Methylotuvimicrobium buryatense]|uniref:HDOD domain-containing protein n=1 Tax=Methylotuvimicrobium buryatense TaxID=95641 RepID=A0A4P9ULF2_METBY|nr:HDOD domain-containing protein [Methylotuvimicrobium buryatense]QCW81937.1 HDOD domain-containing protein [Methylotuvimicrobium buryatense]
MVPKSLIEKVGSLYTLPDVALRVNELLSSDKASNDQLEEIIVHDPALTAQLLKLVNSAYYGFSGKVDTVSRAISMIGRQELRNIVIATSVASTFQDIPKDLVDMETFWYHSITSGVLARLLAEQCKRKEHERFFIAGLLNSIGKLILFSQFPEKAGEALTFKDRGEDAVTEAEQRIFGFTYAELGAELLKEWKLPSSIWQLVAAQTNPMNATDILQDACILHVAAKIAASIEPCSVKTYDFEDFNPTYLPEAWEALGLSDESIKPLTLDASLQAFEILGIIRPGATLIF